MPWTDYQAFLTTMDTGLSLMYTPHPSCPPLGLAALGIPVLTNRYGLKTDLSGYSENILCADPDPDSLLEGLDRLLTLARDRAACLRNRQADGLCRDWAWTLEPVVAKLNDLF